MLRSCRRGSVHKSIVITHTTYITMPMHARADVDKGLVKAENSNLQIHRGFHPLTEKNRNRIYWIIKLLSPAREMLSHILWCVRVCVCGNHKQNRTHITNGKYKMSTAKRHKRKISFKCLCFQKHVLMSSLWLLHPVTSYYTREWHRHTFSNWIFFSA